VIPTYGRDQVLMETIRYVLTQQPAPAELIVVDQTPEHEQQTTVQLRQLDEQGQIRWLRLTQPSITAAMNRGLLETSSPVVLFLDDDLIPAENLIEAHWQAHQ
jgi:glycosyltransferase involved in cell wall biosynthesis